MTCGEGLLKWSHESREWLHLIGVALAALHVPPPWQWWAWWKRRKEKA